MKLRLLFMVLLGFAIFSSCRKNDSVGGNNGTTDENVLKDSTLAISRDVYLWNTQIPAPCCSIATAMAIASAISAPI